MTVASPATVVPEAFAQALREMGLAGTQPLNGTELAWCAAFSSVGLIAVEAEKLLIRRGLILRAPPASP